MIPVRWCNKVITVGHKNLTVINSGLLKKKKNVINEAQLTDAQWKRENNEQGPVISIKNHCPSYTYSQIDPVMTITPCKTTSFPTLKAELTQDLICPFGSRLIRPGEPNVQPTQVPHLACSF